MGTVNFYPLHVSRLVVQYRDAVGPVHITRHGDRMVVSWQRRHALATYQFLEDCLTEDGLVIGALVRLGSDTARIIDLEPEFEVALVERIDGDGLD